MDNRIFSHPTGKRVFKIALGLVAVLSMVLIQGCDLFAPAKDLVQYTPDLANWSTFNTKPFALDNPNTGHDPDGIVWLKDKPWPQWDGTIFDPSKMDKAAFHKALFPNGPDQLIGLRDVFYEHKPFADNRNPTKAEVDEWHRIAINHIRALVGYTGPDREIQPDHALFIRALWGDERQFTEKWDADYPGTLDSAYGPCGGRNSHCGASFFPSDAADQRPYLPAGMDPITSLPGGSEGVFPAPKSNIPWSIKFVRAFSATLSSEGFWGGHTGPWFHREKFGFSFWDDDPNNNNNNAILRAKWGGKLLESRYPNPN